jgi:N6-L-threonylcarbamoyladenine synthase
MKVLGIETSCDETAVAVVEDGRRLLSNVISSQVDIHRRYGGVVPEVASRQHVLQAMPVVKEALSKAQVSLKDIDAIAVTHGPGLAGSLLIGVNLAKSLALSLSVPLVGINHLEGHLYAAWLEKEKPDLDPGFPLLCLIASGGHTDLVLMSGHGQYRLLGRTRDDAAGEGFDKAARILGLGFPGGPEIQKAAQGARPQQKLPRAWLKETHDFSFSGLKTALLHQAQSKKVYPPQNDMDEDTRKGLVRELAAAFQESVVDVMVTKTLEAASEYKARGVLLGGGVTANALLREVFRARADLPVLIPSPVLCTDNGAMVGACGYFQLGRGLRDALDLDVDPALSIG